MIVWQKKNELNHTKHGSAHSKNETAPLKGEKKWGKLFKRVAWLLIKEIPMSSEYESGSTSILILAAVSYNITRILVLIPDFGNRKRIL